METIEVILAHASRVRLERIKALRKAETGAILADMEIIVRAISVYWMICEKRALEKGESS